MDEVLAHFCGVCDRRIDPKRRVVPIHPNPSPPIAKQGTLRQRSGLVHGTGRVRPNGTIKDTLAPSQVRTRIEIDQSPAPLYCSEACRNNDIEYYKGRSPYEDNSDSGSSDDSSLASLSPDDAPLYHQQHQQQRSTPSTRSLAVLGLCPLPPPTSETYDEFAPRRPKATPYRPPEYTSGVMMANRRLEAILPKPLKPGQRAPPLKPIPGWTDGSQAWRASTYSFAAPPRTQADILDPDRTAYQSFVATPHRSAAAEPPSPTAPSCTSSSTRSHNSDLLSSFEDSFAKRASSRLTLFSPSSSPPTASSSSASASPPRKQRHLAHLANGMLLLPDILTHAPLRTTGSTDSLTSLPRGSRRRSTPPPAASFPGAARRVRSPLAGDASPDAASSANSTSGQRRGGASVVSASDTETDEEEAAYLRSVDEAAQQTFYPSPRRPVVETRSWSYDNVRTYPIMPMPPLVEKRIVDGVEVEVEVPRPCKRLFTFAPTVKAAA
ncbi:hypothetical protein C8J57DRAFT_1214392 [Mycena rebaudengoi]|nr:hypothetical protein C8J57DRAFT_1214392 [Mycena rebaudengoi]